VFEGLLGDVLKTTLLDIAALFPIVNPVGNAPIFLNLTHGASADTRALLARKIALNGFVLLVVSMLVGSYILAFFGLSLPVVQVSGGLVLSATGWTLLHTRPDASGEEPAAHSAGQLLHRAFYPLTLPLTVGPGSLSVAVTLGANATGSPTHGLELVLASLLAPAAIGLAIFFSYRWAGRLERAMGETAMSVFLRLSSFILLCIGIQIVWNGVRALFSELGIRN
jgi:multiple antibiotic resistance protein